MALECAGNDMLLSGVVNRVCVRDTAVATFEGMSLHALTYRTKKIIKKVLAPSMSSP